MKIEVHADADADGVAREAAKFIAKTAQDGIATRGKFVMAVSRGRTLWVMLRDFAQESVPWSGVHIFQVDERVALAGHLDRNLTRLRDLRSTA